MKEKVKEFDSPELTKMAEVLSQSMEQQVMLFKTEIATVHSQISAVRADLTVQMLTVQKLISKLDLVTGEQ
ncbi:UNVERIFIED_CONTAM: hypothetical protein FKN15_010357 [Acipenser sinensis]